MTQSKRKTVRKSGASAKTKPTPVPIIDENLPGEVAEWMQNWLDPDAYQKFDVPGHARHVQSTAVDHAEALASSVTTFVDDRLHKDFAALRDLSDCTDFGSLIRVQSMFWQTAWEDYNAQMMRVGDMIRDMVEDTDEVLCETSDEATRVMRKKSEEKA